QRSVSGELLLHLLPMPRPADQVTGLVMMILVAPGSLHLHQRIDVVLAHLGVVVVDLLDAFAVVGPLLIVETVERDEGRRGMMMAVVHEYANIHAVRFEL